MENKEQKLTAEESEILNIELSESQMDSLKNNPWITINGIKYCRQGQVEYLIEKYHTTHLPKEKIINFALEALVRHDGLVENGNGKIFLLDNKLVTIDELFNEFFENLLSSPPHKESEKEEKCTHEIFNKGVCAGCGMNYISSEDNSVSQSDVKMPLEDKPFWLIENENNEWLYVEQNYVEGNTVHSSTFSFEEKFTKDANKAWQFDDKEKANTVIFLSQLSNCKATEHLFSPPKQELKPLSEDYSNVKTWKFCEDCDSKNECQTFGCQRKKADPF